MRSSSVQHGVRNNQQGNECVDGCVSRAVTLAEAEEDTDNTMCWLRPSMTQWSPGSRYTDGRHIKVQNVQNRRNTTLRFKECKAHIPY